MKISQLFSTLSVMILLSSCKNCKHCKTETVLETPPVMLEYLGNYKPGNYWIYENQDGSKRDSMWVSDYQEQLGGARDICIRYPVRSFILNSQYLGLSKRLETTMGNEGSASVTFFRCWDTLSRLIYDFNSDNSEKFTKICQSQVGLSVFYTSAKDTFTLVKYSIK